MAILEKMFSGLVAATFTPLNDDESIDFDRIAPMIDFLIEKNINGFYVLGSTGEGPSFTIDERRQVAQAFVKAVDGRRPVVIQVGCESLDQARELAQHAQSIGASGISAGTPAYFKPDSVETLVNSMARVASGAANLPFFYYHIPGMTQVTCSMLEFLQMGQERIENLKGIKYTAPSVHEFQACVEFDHHAFEILWGMDEMLLSGLTAGASAAIGSTYNYAAPIYHRVINSFGAGDLAQARHAQAQAQALIRAFLPFGPRAAQKAIMPMVGSPAGRCRLPTATLSEAKTKELRQALEATGFFENI